MGCLSSSGKKEKDRSSTSPASEPESPAVERVNTTQNGLPDDEMEPAERMGYTSMVKQLYEALVCSIIRPPRAQYSLRDLGPTTFGFCGRQHRRRDFQLHNSRGMVLQCSHWEPAPSDRPAPCMPCVVFLHGNSSSRAEAMDILNVCLVAGITVVGLDLSGSGLSGGEYVTLGYFERLDLETVLMHLKQDPSVSTVAAWGHSMGAVTSILHAANHPDGSELAVSGIVVDSAFTDLETLAQELVKDGKLLPMNVPGLVVTAALRMIRTTVQKRAEFDIKQLCVVKAAPKCTTPAYFGHGDHDDFIPPHHSSQLHSKYCGPAEIMFFNGDHNSLRPRSFLDGAVQFLKRVMSVPTELAVTTAPTRWGRLPWHSPSRTAQITTSTDEDLETAMLLSLGKQPGRGANNSLQQQLEQQAQADAHKQDVDVVKTLVELGFDDVKAKEAATQHKTVEGAVAHLLEAG